MLMCSKNREVETREGQVVGGGGIPIELSQQQQQQQQRDS